MRMAMPRYSPDSSSCMPAKPRWTWPIRATVPMVCRASGVTTGRSSRWETAKTRRSGLLSAASTARKVAGLPAWIGAATPGNNTNSRKGRTGRFKRSVIWLLDSLFLLFGRGVRDAKPSSRDSIFLGAAGILVRRAQGGFEVLPAGPRRESSAVPAVFDVVGGLVGHLPPEQRLDHVESHIHARGDAGRGDHAIVDHAEVADDGDAPAESRELVGRHPVRGGAALATPADVTDPIEDVGVAEQGAGADASGDDQQVDRRHVGEAVARHHLQPADRGYRVMRRCDREHLEGGALFRAARSRAGCQAGAGEDLERTREVEHLDVVEDEDGDAAGGGAVGAVGAVIAVGMVAAASAGSGRREGPGGPGSLGRGARVHGGWRLLRGVGGRGPAPTAPGSGARRCRPRRRLPGWSGWDPGCCGDARSWTSSPPPSRRR